MKLTCTAILFVCAFIALPLRAEETTVELGNSSLHLSWERKADGWHLAEARAKGEAGWISLPSPSGLHTILYLNRNPALNLVELDREGKAYPFYPSDVEKRPTGALLFKHSLPIGEVES